MHIYMSYKNCNSHTEFSAAHVPYIAFIYTSYMDCSSHQQYTTCIAFIYLQLNLVAVVTAFLQAVPLTFVLFF
jgi:hypothetical protein